MRVILLSFLMLFLMNIVYAEAFNDEYSINYGEKLSANVLENDTGYNKSVIRYGVPSCGNIESFFRNGDFIYDPQNCSGTVTFTYTMQYVQWWRYVTDNATVTITINPPPVTTVNNDTEYLTGFQPFELINPLHTRNVRGNMAIAGNTVLCLTEKTSGYGGTCQDNETYQIYTSNMYVSKYIDIDDNPATWNSSSSYIVLPDSYEEDDNESIIWAGLFWQGRISIDKDRELHFGNRLSSTNYNFIETGRGTDNSSTNKYLDMQNTQANLIDLKIDNGEYVTVKAQNVIGYTSSNGTTYSAFADVTSILQNAHLRKGKHTFTIANLLTEEGRELTPGVFGGWSLVVIYKEDLNEGIVKNFSIYYGFKTAYDDTPIEIKGFRLPKYGEVNSLVTLFSGEGEFRYGKNSVYKSSYDWIKISNKRDSDYQYLPDSNGNPLPDSYEYGNRDNVYDAKLSGILRDSIAGKFNNLYYNNDGVDVDVFNTSKIMKKYRDENKDISMVYLKTLSNNDYVTPSMISFATDLYTPQVCYDFDIKLGDYYTVPVDENRSFTVENFNNLPLNVKVLIKSKEADFDLIHSKLYINFTPDDVFSFDSAEYSLPNTYTYEDAVVIDRDKGVIAIGRDPDNTGGTIGADEIMYSKFYFNFNKNYFKGKFDIYLDTNITFDGENQINYLLTTNAMSDSKMYIPRCPINPIYDPIKGMFNIENAQARFDQTEAEKYSLKTQVVGVPYNITVASYKQDENGDYKEPSTVTTNIELELINAGTFENNSSAGYDTTCENPDYHYGAWVKFKNSARITVEVPQAFIENNASFYHKDVALRNAAFRVWVLVKELNGTKVKVDVPCQNQKDEACFKDLYKEHYAGNDKYCQEQCSIGVEDECYQCLRIYHSIPICSRDNFAIRPYTYDIYLYDNNQTNAEQEVLVGNNLIPRVNHIAAGYAYRLDINATGYGDISRAVGYYFLDANQSSLKESKATYLNSGSSCVDKDDKYINVVIVNGHSTQQLYDGNGTNDNTLFINNVGNYNIYLSDKEWTLVDHQYYPLKPYPNINDCQKNSTEAFPDNPNADHRGCDIQSNESPRYDLRIISHPYKFDLNITLFPDRNFIYLNDLTRNEDTILNNSVMAINLQGFVIAKGKDETILTNYTTGCMAQNLEANLSYYIAPDAMESVAGNPVVLQSAFYNNFVDNNITMKLDSNNTVSHIVPSKYFENNRSLGSAFYNQYINFKRSFNDPVNPFDLNITFLKIESNETLSVDLQSDYHPNGQKEFNSTKTFYYAKVKSKRDFYDDISTNEVKTPIEIDIYCDKSLEYCKKYDINVTSGITNEYNWWLGIRHDSSRGDGAAYLDTDTRAVSVIPTEVKAFDKGVDKNVTVKITGHLEKPTVVKIKPTQFMIDNYSYLLYNKNEDIVPPFIYKVRFVSPPAAWSGEGKTGFTIDENSSGKRTKRIDW